MNPPRPPGRRAGFPLRLEQLREPAPPGAAARGPAAAPTAASLPPAAGTPGGRPTPTAAAARAVLRPQAPLQHAAALAAQAATRVPAGQGLDSADVRRRMVERLRAGGLQDEAVAAALAEVPRHAFVDSAWVAQAYEDTSLPLGHGQTISKPSVVARMIALLRGGATARSQGGLGRVLEIGSGCGYQAAVLAHLGRQVVSIERLKALHDRARANLEALPAWRSRIRLVHGDGMLGHPPNAPYDSIIAAAGGEALPPAWLEQLAVGGRLVAPVEDGSRRQVLVVVDRDERGYRRETFEGVAFVPLKSGLVR
ncbi:protein-L-isoaspartate(D-aspartate) O-methyltransferase [Piscinibacter sakaiensis]|uniref:Protein-L-isoaspartate O-methyltransferase n=1 Tax=Piscinibacter sakaiensis TaxID=1547922 RepID=A0A0K8P6G9_PISS1|nr:protein-L-isoaspartate(D-aspartate) O-methyltransferase [Piscinibacter sakaiensis]GAP38192.1 protein-L-isoaspartate O-methyltransferase [Piscinibacter sakaiensis]